MYHLILIINLLHTLYFCFFWGCHCVHINFHKYAYKYIENSSFLPSNLTEVTQSLGKVQNLQLFVLGGLDQVMHQRHTGSVASRLPQLGHGVEAEAKSVARVAALRGVRGGFLVLLSASVQVRIGAGYLI